MNFDWSDLAFKSKKKVNDLKAVFIAAPREITSVRFTQLVKTYLPQGNIVLGISKEPYIKELEDQPQFKTLKQEDVQGLIDKVNSSKTPYKIYTLTYPQADLKFLLTELKFGKVVFVNGSWYKGFHFRSEFYVMIEKGLKYEKVSPFASEEEARYYPRSVKLPILPKSGLFTDKEMLDVVALTATHSYASSEFQTAAALGRKKGAKYELLATAHNNVVPYETYAMHNGSSREAHFSPRNDLNYYDAVHAEMMLLIAAQEQAIRLEGATLFINLLPCPTCSRALSQTGIDEIVYSQDHSDGYCIKLFEAVGKKVRRLVV